MVDAMLTRGSSKYTREQLADAFDKLKITGGPYQFDTTRANLAESLRLIAHVIKEPVFDAAEFEQLRQQYIVSIEAGRNEPQTLASRAMAEHFNHYPRGDVRAVVTVDEQLADVKAVKPDDLKRFHHEFYGASHGELAIVGDFDQAAILPLIEELFGNWKSRAAYAHLTHENVAVKPMRKVIATPDKENGFYTAHMELDLNIDDPDYPALDLANFIFGESGLKSRLMDRIRQKDGLSYGGGSELEAGDFDRAGGFSMYAIAAPQNLVKVEQAARQELLRVLKDGFTEKELAGAKSGMLQQRLQNRSQDGVLASGWLSYLERDRTYEWSAAYEQKLRAVTLAQLNMAFKKAIDAGQLSVVVAGDQAKMAK
jgi:zinc protease